MSVCQRIYWRSKILRIYRGQKIIMVQVFELNDRYTCTGKYSDRFEVNITFGSVYVLSVERGLGVFRCGT